MRQRMCYSTRSKSLSNPCLLYWDAGWCTEICSVHYTTTWIENSSNQLADNTLYNLPQQCSSPQREVAPPTDWSWLTKRTRNLFEDEDDHDALTTVKRYIVKLSSAINDIDGYKSFVEDGDKFDILTPYEICGSKLYTTTPT
jgi:hypothetical protein